MRKVIFHSCPLADLGEQPRGRFPKEHCPCLAQHQQCGSCSSLRPSQLQEGHWQVEGPGRATEARNLLWGQVDGSEGPQWPREGQVHLQEASHLLHPYGRGRGSQALRVSSWQLEPTEKGLKKGDCPCLGKLEVTREKALFNVPIAQGLSCHCHRSSPGQSWETNQTGQEHPGTGKCGLKPATAHPWPLVPMGERHRNPSLRDRGRGRLRSAMGHDTLYPLFLTHKTLVVLGSFFPSCFFLPPACAGWSSRSHVGP